MGNWADGMSSFHDLLDILCIIIHKIYWCYMQPQYAIKFDYSLLSTGAWWHSGQAILWIIYKKIFKIEFLI